jgi:ferrous iron transport protein A
MKSNVVTLAKATSGEMVKIHSIPRGLIYTQFVRFGIGEGERVLCVERLPGGPIVLKKNRQEIAVGHKLAEQISVVIVRMEEELAA